MELDGFTSSSENSSGSNEIKRIGFRLSPMSLPDGLIIEACITIKWKWSNVGVRAILLIARNIAKESHRNEFIKYYLRYP